VQDNRIFRIAKDADLKITLPVPGWSEGYSVFGGGFGVWKKF
jgi:hypothetical protein